MTARALSRLWLAIESVLFLLVVLVVAVPLAVWNTVLINPGDSIFATWLDGWANSLGERRGGQQ